MTYLSGMPWFGKAVIALAIIQGGWLVFDGGRAIIIGDYVTPHSGQRAGQLGLWARIVSLAGIEPRSTLMKIIHIGLGLGWLGVATGLVLNAPWARPGVLACAVLSLWYLPVGTLLSAIQIVLMLAWSR